jgi:hypothetical protein
MAVAAGGAPGRAPLPQEAADARFGGMQTLDTDQDGLTDHIEPPAALPSTGGGFADGFASP